MDLEKYKTAIVQVVTGCNCPDSVKWFNCRCNASKKEYACLPFNIDDILNKEDDIHDGSPTIESLAWIIKMNPTSKMIYEGGNFKINGKTHFQHAMEM
jgi:hypothetical protein